MNVTTKSVLRLPAGNPESIRRTLERDLLFRTDVITGLTQQLRDNGADGHLNSVLKKARIFRVDEGYEMVRKNYDDGVYNNARLFDEVPEDTLFGYFSAVEEFNLEIAKKLDAIFPADRTIWFSDN